MFYATAGQQATQQPPTSRGAVAGYGRAAPPGFGGRGANPNDFPALGALPQLSSSYAAQAQPSNGAGSGGQQPNSAGQSGQHLQQQQQLFLQQQQQLGSVPPPPGISGGANAGAVGSGQANGDDFPALNTGNELKDARLANYLRQNPANPASQGQPSSPSIVLANGNLPSAAQSTNATPSTQPSHLNAQGLATSTGGPPSTADSSWQRPPSPRPSEPVTRPIQQILSSPVDKWGLKALLYEIQMHMNKTDRGMLVFGEELEELGMDVNGEDALFPTFVTPWTDANSLSQPPRIEETYHIPQCYHVQAPPVTTKLPNFTEDTLFLAFYLSPQDVQQLEVAEELYTRGWRYHTDLQTWITSPTLPNIDLVSIHSEGSGQPHWIRGPFMYLDTRTWTKQRTLEDFTIDAQLLEATRPASAIIAEEQARKEGQKSPRATPPQNAAAPNQSAY
ncbi:hypothetical protein IAU60_002934 [Kwoniella sp. DSM 27419]